MPPVKKMHKIIVLLVLTLQEVHCKSQCSGFHYEERTLEKMIRLEILVDKLKAEIDETLKRTSDMLGDLQKQKVQSSKELTDLQEQVKKELEKQITDVNNLKDSILTPTVVFQAGNPSTLNPGAGDKIVFRTTIQDTAHSYDNKTGIFRAPFAGTYLFNVQLCLASGSRYIHYHIFVENAPVTHTLLFDASQRFCNSATAVVILEKDHCVHVTVWGSTVNALKEAYGERNMFTGVLLKLEGNRETLTLD